MTGPCLLWSSLVLIGPPLPPVVPRIVATRGPLLFAFAPRYPPRLCFFCSLKVLSGLLLCLQITLLTSLVDLPLAVSFRSICLVN
jgi:hypothetical protein